MIPISDADTIDISYGGLVAKDGSALIWFISGNEYQAHYYLPMECRVAGENEYVFERTYKPTEPAADIAALQWQRGCVFLINNPDCKLLRIVDAEGIHDIATDKACPFIYFHHTIGAEYLFLDSKGKEIS